MRTWSSALDPVERDHGVTISAPLAVTGQNFVVAVLDPNDIGEWDREPTLGDAARQTAVVRRIDEGQIVRVSVEPGDEPQRIHAVNDCRVAGAKGGGVGLDGGQTPRRRVDEVGGSRTARQRLESERARSGKQVEDASLVNPGLHDAHPRFTDAVARWTDLIAARRLDASPSPSSADDAHASGTEVGESRLQARFAIPFVALESIGDVDRHPDVQFAPALTHSPSQRDELAAGPV